MQVVLEALLKVHWMVKAKRLDFRAMGPHSEPALLFRVSNRDSASTTLHRPCLQEKKRGQCTGQYFEQRHVNAFHLRNTRSLERTAFGRMILRQPTFGKIRAIPTIYS